MSQGKRIVSNKQLAVIWVIAAASVYFMFGVARWSSGVEINWEWVGYFALIVATLTCLVVSLIDPNRERVITPADVNQLRETLESAENTIERQEREIEALRAKVFDLEVEARKTAGGI